MAFSPSARADLVTPRPLGERALACSFRHPICVHGGAGATDADALGVVRAAERAWDVAVDVIDLPPPDPDIATNAYDIYLAPKVDGGSHTFAATRDAASAFDRASAFTLLDATLRGDARAYAISRGIFRAISFRVAPATEAATAEAEATALADLVVPQAPHDTLFETRPDRAVCDAWPDAPALMTPFARGASFFYSWLDESYANAPGGFTRALWALTPTVTPFGAPDWVDKPNTFDVFHMTFKVQNTSISYGDFLLDFAIARAFDANVTARRDWEIDWPNHPRRLAPSLPIAPTGSSYVLVRRSGAAPGAKLRVEATWEEHAMLRWEALKLDANGNEIARAPILGQDKGTSAQITIENLDGVSAVLLVAVNVGDDAVPFDPNGGVWEPHGYLLTVASE